MPSSCPRMRLWCEDACVLACCSDSAGAGHRLGPLLLSCGAVQRVLTRGGRLQKQAQLSPVQKQVILELRSGFMDQLQTLVTERR